jgi:hypothetical protein
MKEKRDKMKLDKFDCEPAKAGSFSVDIVEDEAGRIHYEIRTAGKDGSLFTGKFLSSFEPDDDEDEGCGWQFFKNDVITRAMKASLHKI